MSSSSYLVTLSLLVVSSWLLAFTSAVGPVMNQQPTIFDLIQNDPDLSEVRISVSYIFVCNISRKGNSISMLSAGVITSPSMHFT
jgi:hypothetical protein